MGMTKHIIWAVTLILIVLTICGTLIYLNNNSWTVRFEMDNNTKEAIESIEYPIIDNTLWYEEDGCYFDNQTCNYKCCDDYGNCKTSFMSNSWCHQNLNYSQKETESN